MQKAPVLKGSGLKPLEDSKPNEEIHVFGRNLEERIVANDEESLSISSDNIKDNKINHVDANDDGMDSIKKRKFEAITGEEDEETVFQGDFKLYIWDLSTSNWVEKGRGQLKLNDSTDKDKKRSRLIMRVSGTHRILLNVAINHPYFKVIVWTKNNIRFTDSQSVWAASGSNAHQLRDLLDERLKKEEVELRKRTKTEENEEEEVGEGNKNDEGSKDQEIDSKGNSEVEKAVEGSEVNEVGDGKEVEKEEEAEKVKETEEVKESTQADTVTEDREAKTEEDNSRTNNVDDVKDTNETEEPPKSRTESPDGRDNE